MRASVVIPARDEALVIERTLRTLLADARDGEFDVVIVCNGCRDHTAAVARAAHPAVRVLETQCAGKAAALNLGDATALAWPRIYMDADVRMSTSALRATVEALSSVPAAAPRLRWEPEGASWCVRRYLEIRRRLPDAQLGTGVYGLTEEARRRFGPFPEVIADDLFVCGLFAPDERRTVSSHDFAVTPPRTLRGLVRQKARVFAGNTQLTRLPDRGPHVPCRWQLRFALRRLPRRLWPALTVYAGVQAAAKLGALCRRRAPAAAWNVERGSRASLGVRAPRRLSRR
jgi:glycosyltransferase involved in cell wall biosynthesis